MILSKIQPIRFYCQKILPAVYDDSLSYYEVLNRLAAKLNEVIEVVGDTATIAALEEAIKVIDEEIISLKDYVDAQDEEIKIYSDAKNDALWERTLATIRGLSLGNVIVNDQSYGLHPRDIQIVLDKQYDFLRPMAVQANDYDEIKLTAETYDGLNLEAREFDIIGALMLYDYYGG